MLAKTKEDAHILGWLFRTKFAASDAAMAGEVRKEYVASGKLEVKVAVLDVEVENFHQVEIKGVLQAAFTTMKFPDMHIVAEGDVEIPCHREIFSAVSPVFDRMLSHEMLEGARAIVELRDVPAQLVRNFVECVYTAVIPSGWDFTEIEGLFWIADKYQIAPLARKCADILCSCVSGSTVLSVLRIFGHVRHANGEYQDAFARVMQMVSKDEELLRVVCTTVSELSCDGTKTETCRSVDSAQASNSPETML